MSYQVLARKCRPQKFSEVVGQTHISRTLQNAIINERVGHAYLFVGPRGTGKTTSARIFAKALNCEKGIVSEPCCQCQSCLEIAAGTSLDVIEIDGASHNKVEHIRDIRENVQYAPNRSKFKIYIIDEVHMLTTAAWNALLKTLEEPPAHVKFLFATTEPHKVLPTIISRCQRFDLKPIPIPLIIKHLKEITQAENITVEPQALTAIARAANGGMRDAQSIMDQMISFCGGEDNKTELISEKDVIDVFGLASSRELLNLIAATINNDANQALTIIQNLADKGRNLERLYEDILDFMRSIMICSVCTNPRQLLDISDDEYTSLKNIATSTTPALIQRILHGLVASGNSLKYAINKRIYLEVTIIKVMQEAHSVQLNEIIARLNQLRKDGKTPIITNIIQPTPIPEVTPQPQPIPTPEPIPQPEAIPYPLHNNEIPSQNSNLIHEEIEPYYPRIETEAEIEPTIKDNDDPNTIWQQFIDQIANNPKTQHLSIWLNALKPVSYIKNILTISYEQSADPKQITELTNETNLNTIQNSFQKLTNTTNAKIVLKKWIDTISNNQQEKVLSSSPELKNKLEKHPFVQQVCTLFNAHVIDVRG